MFHQGTSFGRSVRVKTVVMVRKVVVEGMQKDGSVCVEEEERREEKDSVLLSEGEKRKSNFDNTANSLCLVTGLATEHVSVLTPRPSQVRLDLVCLR